jgi:hypothetical protein
LYVKESKFGGLVLPVHHVNPGWRPKGETKPFELGIRWLKEPRIITEYTAVRSEGVAENRDDRSAVNIGQIAYLTLLIILDKLH